MSLLLLALLGFAAAGGDTELALERFRAAEEAHDPVAMRTYAAEALSASPEDWRAHQAWQRAQEERPWWLNAEYAALQRSEDPELALMGAWYAAHAARQLPRAPQGVDPLLAAQVRARAALDLGQPEVALAVLDGRDDPISSELRLEALWVQGELRALGKECKGALERWPEHLELAAWLWRADGVSVKLARKGALSRAEAALASEDPLVVYRAHHVFVAAEEGERAGQAAARLMALGEPVPLGSRAPWAPSMVRDLGRVLAVQRTPRPPPGGTPQEDARVLAATARTLERQGKMNRAQDTWRAAVLASDQEPRLLVRAAVGLELSGAPPEEVLELVQRARQGLALSDTLGGGVESERDLLAQLALTEARALRRLGEMEQALSAAALADALGGSLDALLLRAELCEELGRPDAAFTAYARAAAAGAPVEPGTLERLYQGPAAAQVVVEALSTLEPEPPRAPARRPEGLERFPVDTLHTDKGAVQVGAGEVVVVAFWASWCGPCALELPALDALAAQMSDEGLPVRVVAISLDEAERDAGRWLGQRELTLPVGWDPPLGKQLGVTALPTLWIIDGRGVVRARHQGYVPGDEAGIEGELRVILQGGEPTP